MKGWVNAYYPGTKIGVTEYNWGAEGDMNGATTQADLWGIFGREGLDLANRWTTPATGSPTYLAMKLFRNYDGNGSGLGGTRPPSPGAHPGPGGAPPPPRPPGAAVPAPVGHKSPFYPN